MSRKWVLAVLVAPLLTVSRLDGQRASGRSAGPEILGPVFLALQVADVDSAAAWYGTVFSLGVVKEIDTPDGRYRIRILTNAAMTVELIETRDIGSPPAYHLGLFKFGFYVSDIDAAFNWYRGMGVATDDSIFIDDVLSVRSFLMRDQEGNRLQVFARCQGDC